MDQKKPNKPQCKHEGAKRGVGTQVLANMHTGQTIVVASVICETCWDIVTIAHPIDLPQGKPPVSIPPKRGVALN